MNRGCDELGAAMNRVLRCTGCCDALGAAMNRVLR